MKKKETNALGDNYAIYTYDYEPIKDEGDWTQGEEVKEVDMNHAQDFLYKLFGPLNTIFQVRNSVNKGGKKYDCKVFGNDHRVVALRLLNSLVKSYYEEVPDPQDSMGAVEKKSVTSTPYTYVVIDCRPGHKILAVKVDKEAWRNTDTVRDLMETSINNHLRSLSRGFRIKLSTKMVSHDFYDYTNKRLKKEGRFIKGVNLRFKTGKLDPKVETIVKGSRYLKGLFAFLDSLCETSGLIKLDHPFAKNMLDRHRVTGRIISLIISDPIGYAMDVIFDDNVTLHYGKDIRAELPMDPPGALDLFHKYKKQENNKQLEIFDTTKNEEESKYHLESWLDKMAEETKKMKDAETGKRKRSKSNKRKIS